MNRNLERSETPVSLLETEVESGLTATGISSGKSVDLYKLYQKNRGLTAEEAASGLELKTDKDGEYDPGQLAAAKRGIEAIKLEYDEHPKFREALAKNTEQIQKSIFYTDASYGAREHFDKLFAAQKQAQNDLNGFGYKELVTDQNDLLIALFAGQEAIDRVTADIDPEFFGDIAPEAFKEVNELFFENIVTENKDCSAALKMAKGVADNIRAEQKKFNEAQKALNNPKRLEHSVDHCLFDEKNLLELQKDPQKIHRLLKDRYGIEFDTRFVEAYLTNNLIGPYVARVEKGYTRQLKENKVAVAQGHQEVLAVAADQFFASKSDFENFVQNQMQQRFPDQKNGKEKKYMPNSEWDRISARNRRSAEQSWERRIIKGEKATWGILDQGLTDLKNQKFSTELDFQNYLKALGEKAETAQFLPNESWDELISSQFKEKATSAWESHLETQTTQVWKTLDQTLSQAEAQNFHDKKDLIAFIQKATSTLNEKKLVPDEHWNQLIAKGLRAKVDTLWTSRDKAKKIDSDRVREAMKSVSLAHTEKPITTADFYQIAKKNLPDIQGKLTDNEWDAHMRTYFYPRVKAQLKENEKTVSQAMKTASLPSATEYSSQADYLAAARSYFGKTNKHLMGLIPNSRYDTLRSRLLTSRAKETWKANETSETGVLDQARAALNDENLIKTVHHFAKNKKISEPTTAEIKASSVNALAAQFSLNKAQLKTLSPEIGAYAAQATALHKSRRHAAENVIKSYQVPGGHEFSEVELSAPLEFRKALSKLNGDMEFGHVDDWYLVETTALDHIEGLRLAEINRAKETKLLPVENVTDETDKTDVLNAEKGSQELAENQVETASKHPTEQTDWMKRFGIPTEAVSQKGVERFSRVMKLPEFNLGGIPPADLKIALPALVNMLGGFRQTTWKNFTLKIRTDLRGLEDRGPRSRFFQIIQSFAVGYPYKLTDFDKVPGIDNVFNNLVKRTKNPEGEKFTTIKNLYLHYVKSGDREALDEIISDEAFELALQDIESVEDGLANTENLIGEVLEAEAITQTIADKPLPVEDLVPVESEALPIIEEEKITDIALVEAETEILPTEEEADIEDAVLLPVEGEDLPEQVTGEPTEAEEIDGSSTEINTDEVTETIPDPAYNDYLQEGAVVLTEADQMLRTPEAEEPEVETETEVLLAQQRQIEAEEERRLQKEKPPIEEAAEVVPDKLHKALLKLSFGGLLSDEAISWLIENSTEFAVVEEDDFVTLQQALAMIEISLRSQFLVKNFQWETKLSQGLHRKAVMNFGEFFQMFMTQAQAVDGLQKIVISGHRNKKLRGYFVTRFGKKAFAFDCALKTPQKVKSKSA